MIRTTSCIALILCLAQCADAGFISAGRKLPEARDKRFSITLGTVENMDALVEETTRRLYDVTGSYWKQDDAEAFDLNDFGIDDSHAAIGFEFENNGDFWTFMWDATFFSMSSETTARRNYYIGVGDGIDYEGNSYNNMRIPQGTDFTIDVLGCQSDLRLLFTPFTLTPTETIRFSPWGSLSIMLFLGQYDIDAGPPTGTYVYMNPPVTFVEGGSAGGLIGLGLPEVGGGGELRLGSIKSGELVLQGNYAVCNIKGSTRWMTSSRHRSKNAHIVHENIYGRAILELPFGDDRTLSIGAQYQQIDSEALITQQSTDPEEILANQERFDKYVRFHMETTMLLIGLTF